MNQKTKMRYTFQKGITLIALVITIIVLLILAGITISVGLGDDGIIAQAQKAKEEQKEAEDKEKDDIRVGEGAIDKYIEGTLANKAEKGELKIGEYIQYDYVKNDYTVEASRSGYTNDQEFSSKDNENAEINYWRVISTDGGVIKLLGVFDEEQAVAIRDDRVGSGVPLTSYDKTLAISASKKLAFNGETGFLNAPEILNEMCETLYSGSLGTARSINIDDIFKIIGYQGVRVYTNESGASVAATEEQQKIGDLELELTGDVKVPGKSNISKENIDINYRLINTNGGNSATWLRNNLATPPSGTSEEKTKELKEIYKMLFYLASNDAAQNDGGSSYWLASKGNQIDFKNNVINYRINNVSAYAINGQWIYDSNGDSRTTPIPALVRPIVTLKSGLTIESGEGTAGSPYVVK